MTEAKDIFRDTTDANDSANNRPREHDTGDSQQLQQQHPAVVTSESEVSLKGDTMQPLKEHTTEHSSEKQPEKDTVQDLTTEKLQQLEISDSSAIMPEVVTEIERDKSSAGGLVGEHPIEQQEPITENNPEAMLELTDKNKSMERLNQLPELGDNSAVVPEATDASKQYGSSLENNTAEHPHNSVIVSIEGTTEPSKEEGAVFLEETVVEHPKEPTTASSVEENAGPVEAAVEQPRALATPTLPNEDTAEDLKEEAVVSSNNFVAEIPEEQLQEHSANMGIVSNDVEAEITTPLSGKPQQKEQKPRLPPRQPKSAEGYRLKDIQWQDPLTGRQREVKIVTQNENGPCPLIALANVLSLTGEVSLGPASKRSTTDEELTGLLANHLLGRESGTPPADQVTMILSLLPTMNKGLDVDLQFSHIYGFAATPPVQLFRAFGVDLVHGWVVDPDSESHIASLLSSECRNSYEGAVEFILSSDELSNGQVVNQDTVSMALRSTPELSESQQETVCRAIALNDWLTTTATQLTPCGLRLLTSRLPVGSLCVLFRNNHFSTIFKHKSDTLLLLCTDDVVAGDSRIVWESLCDVHQASSQFLDSEFRPLGINPTKGKLPEGDYAQQSDSHRSRNEQEEDARQIDSDYAMALRLQEQEQQEQERARRMRSEDPNQLQVRQQDHLPPGMAASGHLYGVPEVTRTGESRMSRAMYRTASDENFSRQMEGTFLPQQSTKSQRQGHEQRLRQQQEREKQKADQDKCIIC
ncbi:DUF544-domain-containing protein [Coemansia reversa NRRL 1564]|uniref:DUF544-domain-containing protein n=1 Tax=Coemansia reversa (strain ATCC 12441 / NRRL 1564) TaxID=763665 RepID=A0A2G5BB26_COERN|nr:DUF544-domain-containing protein [Coemansia reversa NRRL 1564]|eukprot:PIA16211.1 DUF544-domain-containing protein [Coemansia reversa NRRL 1564]